MIYLPVEESTELPFVYSFDLYVFIFNSRQKWRERKEEQKVESSGLA